jgi:hypothetical protein
MQIARNSLDTRAGPSDWFTGAVYIDTIAALCEASGLSASSVHFSPGRADRNYVGDEEYAAGAGNRVRSPPTAR